MAVYTHVPAEDIDAFLARYDAGRLVSAKGIAEGVENSNYLLETTGPDSQAGGGQRYILTLYEKRVDEADLPFFMDLLDHLGARGCRVPRFIADRDGRRLQQLAGRPACLIEFLTGTRSPLGAARTWTRSRPALPNASPTNWPGSTRTGPATCRIR